MEVNAFIFLKFFSQPVDNAVVKVIATQMCITIGRFYFKYTFTQFEDGNIESSATKDVNSNFNILMFFIESVSQCSGCRLINNTANIQSGNFTGFFGSLALSVTEIGRNCDNGFTHRSTQVIFGSFFHFLQNDG